MRTVSARLMLAVLLSALTAPAAAQDEQPDLQPDPDGDSAVEARLERARELFREGLGLAEERDFETAAARFREALAIHDAPAIKYNLASALFELDRPEEAAALVEEVLASPDVPREIRRPAEALRDRLAEHVGRLTVEVSGDTEGVEVLLDDEPVAADRLGSPMPVRVGMHTLVASRDTRELMRRTIEVGAGQSATVELAVAPTAGEAARTVVDSPPDDTPEPASRSVASDWRFWVGVGGGVVVVAVVIVVIAVVAGGMQAPIRGNYDPPVLRFP